MITIISKITPDAIGTTKFPLIFRYPLITDEYKNVNIVSPIILVKFAARLRAFPLSPGEKAWK